MSGRFIYKVASVPDRERDVCEIWDGNVQWAELSHEDDTLRLQFYPRPGGGFWEFTLDDVVAALREAKSQLVGND
jgi:hypothetical protein